MRPDGILWNLPYRLPLLTPQRVLSLGRVLQDAKPIYETGTAEEIALREELGQWYFSDEALQAFSKELSQQCTPDCKFRTPGLHALDHLRLSRPGSARGQRSAREDWLSGSTTPGRGSLRPSSARSSRSGVSTPCRAGGTNLLSKSLKDNLKVLDKGDGTIPRKTFVELLRVLKIDMDLISDTLSHSIASNDDRVHYETYIDWIFDSSELPPQDKVIYVAEDAFNKCKAKLKAEQPIDRDDVKHVIPLDEQFPPATAMIPVDLHGICRFDEGLGVLLKQLGPKGTIEAFVKGEERLAAVRLKLPESERFAARVTFDELEAWFDEQVAELEFEEEERLKYGAEADAFEEGCHAAALDSALDAALATPLILA